MVTVLGADYRNIKTFATLSPMPGFRRWLDGKLKDGDAALLSAEEASALVALFTDDPKPASGPAALAAVLARRGWPRDTAMAKALEPILMRLGARYLLAESQGKRALDPVAHFHLTNGARVERIMMGADTSEKGVRESATLMVNYLYDPAKIEEYHEEYSGEGKRNATTAIRRMSRGWA